MAFFKITSPHTTRALSTGNVMQQVMLATLPGVAVMTFFFGIGTLLNIFLACVFAILFETIALYMRNKPIAFYLKDYSAIVTAVLLGICLPPYAPWWLIATGMFFSIIVAKQLYGGLGYNPFNPAMVGYVVLLISFPLDMSQWVAPSALNEGVIPSFSQAIQKVFLNKELLISQSINVDGYTAATPLELMRQTDGLTIANLYERYPLFNQGFFAGLAWEWVNIAFLLGGIYLLYKRIFTWHAPLSMLVTITVLSAVFYDGGSSSSFGSPLFHLFSGATMFGAFFIITDPVSSAVSTKGRMIFGALIGVIIFLIRSFGNYPDGVAFAVLLLNFAAPFIDYYTKPRTYGHSKKSHKKGEQ